MKSMACCTSSFKWSECWLLLLKVYRKRICRGTEIESSRVPIVCDQRNRGHHGFEIGDATDSRKLGQARRSQRTDHLGTAGAWSQTWDNAVAAALLTRRKGSANSSSLGSSCRDYVTLCCASVCQRIRWTPNQPESFRGYPVPAVFGTGKSRGRSWGHCN